jgi:3-hydroxyisobutyrate dehydrogenase-like beta-hydroxyacid dehydrogenase
MAQKVGMLGLGIMGSGMSANLLAAGWEVVGYDPERDKVAALEQAGGRGAGSSEEVAGQCPVIISVLPNVEALDDVVDRVAKGGGQGNVLVECSTFPLEDKHRARKRLTEAGVAAMDCPLSGTGHQAKSKDLAVYASGRRQDYEACVPVFEGFARSHYYLGEYGLGTKMKMVANLLVAIHNVSAAEAFVLGMKAGLDPQQILDVVGDGAGTSRMFEVRGPLMVENKYDEATMKVDVFQKDMKIISGFAKDLNCPLPVFSAAGEIYTQALAQGRAKQDTASVLAVLENMANSIR